MTCVNKTRGFTLVEMLVSLLIISVAVAFSTIIIGTIKVTRDSAYENVALRIADSKLDELRAGGYATLPSDGEFSSPELMNIPQGFASTSVTALNEKTKKVTAGVSWRDANGLERYISLTTLVTESGGL
ncbi:MAG: type II secretion system protein [bacterium]|nr:type II secretion system protein [bacterium]